MILPCPDSRLRTPGSSFGGGAHSRKFLGVANLASEKIHHAMSLMEASDTELLALQDESPW